MSSGAATICAIATPPGFGGVGIIRVSGPSAHEVARAVVARVPEVPEPRKAYLADFTDREGGFLDQGLVIFFAGPNSYTGENVVELQTHGSPRLLSILQRELLMDARVRLAEPGEFTRRAFLNGRVDLERAEAVGALIEAQTEGAVRAAAASLRGALSGRVRPIAEALLSLETELEGVLNFPDEAESAETNVAGSLTAALLAIEDVVATARRGRLLRRVPKVVLYGPVNAGKSTLFNRLLGEERAIVDEDPGTTRDVLEARIEMEGSAFDLVDTAGLRDAAGRVEARGIERTRLELREAALAVLLVPPGASSVDVDRWSAESAAHCPVLVVYGKSDATSARSDGALSASGRTGDGVDALRAAIDWRLGAGESTSTTFATSERQWEALLTALEALKRGVEQLNGGTLELVAGEVGLAAAALETVSGSRAPSAVLDGVFQRFCIGK